MTLVILDFNPRLSVSCSFCKKLPLTSPPIYLVPTAQSSLFASPLTSASYFLRADSLAQPNTKQDAGHCRLQALELSLLVRLAQGAQILMLVGVDTCDYVYWDTGNLSSVYQQQGTCWYWANPKFGYWWGAAYNFKYGDRLHRQ